MSVAEGRDGHRDLAAGTDDGSADRFAALVEAFARTPAVQGPDPAARGFGSGALKVDGSIFAMLTRGGLVLKLPRARVADLIRTGHGVPFTAGRAAPLGEWVGVRGDDPATWLTLAHEALAFTRQH